MNRVINNQDRVASRINRMGLDGVSAVGDDGSVCVRVSGSRQRLADVVRAISANCSDVVQVGDGVQSGSIWINADDCDVHDDLDSVVSMF